MADRLAPTPIAKPDIVVPDAAPPVHLASAGLPRPLHEVGGTVVVVDMVAHWITRDAAKPGAAILRDRLASGGAPDRVERGCRDRVAASAPTANPRLQSFSQRRQPR